jgi:hypothetical protein
LGCPSASGWPRIKKWYKRNCSENSFLGVNFIQKCHIIKFVGQTDGETNRQTDIHTYRQTDIQTGKSLPKKRKPIAPNHNWFILCTRGQNYMMIKKVDRPQSNINDRQSYDITLHSRRIPKQSKCFLTVLLKSTYQILCFRDLNDGLHWFLNKINLLNCFRTLPPWIFSVITLPRWKSRTLP